MGERLTGGWGLVCVLCAGLGRASGQTTPDAPAASQVGLPNARPVAASGEAITLEQALARARANEPTFAAAVAASKSATYDRKIARAALLPQVGYHNQFQYTEPNGARNQAGSTGSQAAPKFIANNAVKEYATQGVVTETLGLGRFTEVARASAAEAIAAAELEISRRGLTATVIRLFYAVTTTATKVSVATRALDETNSFVTLTSQREAAREAAHADVIKAQLSQQQRQRELDDATLEAAKARVELGVLLFPDPRTPYTTVTPEVRPLPTQAEIEADANKGNPELRSALAAVHASDLDIRAARAAYLPDLALNFTYGIDAEQLKVTGPDGTRNLGYSTYATVDIPVWDWLATHDKVKQAQIQRDAAKVQLSAAQRTLIAELDEYYGEAALAAKQLESLQQSVATAGESLRLTRLRYSAGESTVLEVVDAENSLTAAELGLADGTTRYQAALANLQMLTGAY